MKKVYWKTTLYLSIVSMMAGFFTALYGIFYKDTNLAYAGFSVIAVVCISWWVWVMVVIKTMIDFTTNTATKITDIREGIREVRQLFKEYENLRRR